MQRLWVNVWVGTLTKPKCRNGIRRELKPHCPRGIAGSNPAFGTNAPVAELAYAHD